MLGVSEFKGDSMKKWYTIEARREQDCYISVYTDSIEKAVEEAKKAWDNGKCDNYLWPPEYPKFSKYEESENEPAFEGTLEIRKDK